MAYLSMLKLFGFADELVVDKFTTVLLLKMEGAKQLSRHNSRTSSLTYTHNFGIETFIKEDFYGNMAKF